MSLFISLVCTTGDSCFRPEPSQHLGFNSPFIRFGCPDIVRIVCIYDARCVMFCPDIILIVCIYDARCVMFCPDIILIVCI